MCTARERQKNKMAKKTTKKLIKKVKSETTKNKSAKKTKSTKSKPIKTNKIKTSQSNIKQYIACCITGLENIAQDEIKKLIQESSEILIQGKLIINTTEEKIGNLIYNTRSLTYVYELLKESQITNLEQIREIAKDIDFKNIIKQNFMVQCNREGQHPFKSIDIEKELGAYIHETYKFPVNLENPITTVFVDVLDAFCAIGIDLTGHKLSKRDYRIKLTSQPTNPCIAYSLIKLSNWNAKESLLDPFAKAGEIPIEAALLATNISPQKHIKNKLLFLKLYPNTKLVDKETYPKTEIYSADEIMGHVRYAETNAKLAGVNKQMRFTHMETQWLDSKFKKGTINKIISFPAQISQLHPMEELEQRYKDFFYNAEYILKKQGTITLLMNTNLELVHRFASEYKFKVFNKIEFRHANQDHIIIQLKK